MDNRLPDDGIQATLLNKGAEMVHPSDSDPNVNLQGQCTAPHEVKEIVLQLSYEKHPQEPQKLCWESDTAKLDAILSLWAFSLESIQGETGESDQ